MGTESDLSGKLLYSTPHGTPVMISSVIGILDDLYMMKPHDEVAPLIGDPRFVIAKRRSESYKRQLLDMSEGEEELEDAHGGEGHSVSSSRTRNSYDPFFLDDPGLRTGKHRTVMALPAFIVHHGWSII